MNATVKFLADDDKSASKEPSGAIVPALAVRDRDGKKVVFIASADGKAVMKTVRVISQRSDGYLVDGPINGENVITSAPENLKDGQSIKIKGQSS
jgi:multidrug efflux pump subunit AcrA (membrane-fusion protein)